MAEIAGISLRRAVVLEGLERMMQEPWGGERFRPAQLLKTKVRAGHLGKKAGRGFHEYLDL